MAWLSEFRIGQIVNWKWWRVAQNGTPFAVWEKTTILDRKDEVEYLYFELGGKGFWMPYHSNFFFPDFDAKF